MVLCVCVCVQVCVCVCVCARARARVRAFACVSASVSALVWSMQANKQARTQAPVVQQIHAHGECDQLIHVAQDSESFGGYDGDLGGGGVVMMMIMIMMMMLKCEWKNQRRGARAPTLNTALALGSSTQKKVRLASVLSNCVAAIHGESGL